MTTNLESCPHEGSLFYVPVLPPVPLLAAAADFRSLPNFVIFVSIGKQYNV